MTFTKKIVCLANSKKYAQRCVAGKELQANAIGDWIRPVSKQPKGELAPNEMSYQGGCLPALLDVLTITLTEHTPHTYQTENYLIDPTYYWVKDSVFPINQLWRLRDNPNSLWINGYHSSCGYNDRIPVDEAQEHVTSSLVLIKPLRLSLVVAQEQAKRRVRAEFRYCQDRYRLMVTDPLVEDKFLRRANGVFRIDQPSLFFCISLSEPFNGCCYKLVAAVIPPL